MKLHVPVFYVLNYLNQGIFKNTKCAINTTLSCRCTAVGTRPVEEAAVEHASCNFPVLAVARNSGWNSGGSKGGSRRLVEGARGAM